MMGMRQVPLHHLFISHRARLLEKEMENDGRYENSMPCRIDVPLWFLNELGITEGSVVSLIRCQPILKVFTEKNVSANDRWRHQK